MTAPLLLLLYALLALAIAAAARWQERLIPARVFLPLFALPLLFFAPAFFTRKTILPIDHLRVPPWSAEAYSRPHNPYFNDVMTQFLPWREAARLAWKEGSLPLRNRWNGCGTPLAANGSSAVFSPLMLLTLLLPLAEGFALAAAAKLLLALTGTWLWLTELRVSQSAALFGAIAFSFSLTMSPWLLFPQTAVLCLWPWCLFAIERLRTGRSGRAFWLLVLLFTLWPLSGHIESVASGAAFTAVWLLARIPARDSLDARRTLSRLFLAAGAAVGLSAFSLLPQSLAVLASNRFAQAGHEIWRVGLSWLPHALAWPQGLWVVFFPRSLGDGIESPLTQGAAGAFPEMALGYFGIVGWGCALLLLRPGSPRRRTEWALLAPLLAGLGIALGLWPFAEVAGLVPGLDLMFPLRYLSWVALAGAALAAFELDRLREDARGDRRALFFPGAVAAGLAVFALAVFARLREQHAAAGGLESQKGALLLTFLVLALFALIPAALASGKFVPAFPIAAPLAFLCAAELFLQGARLYRYGSPAGEGGPFPSGTLISLLASKAGPLRVAGEGTFLFPNTNIFARVEDIRTHDPIERRDYVEFLDAAAGYAPGDYFKMLRDVDSPALDFLNVRYLLTGSDRPRTGERWKLVYAGRDGVLYENPNVLPRVFAPKRVRVKDSFDPRLFSDWREEAVVLPNGNGAFRPSDSDANDRVSVSAYTERTNSASFRATVAPGKGEAILVASLVQDGGWSASTEKGLRLPVGRANGPFLAMALPPGDHLVRLRYLPPGFRAGVTISLATVAVLAAVLVLRRFIR